MAGYRSGAIAYTNYYTIIYAGRIVDTAASYREFVRDRTERLDRYSAVHGEGWMWYEPPLNVHPEAKPTMLASVALQREENATSMGTYYAIQGFWKRAGFVRRMAQTATALPSPNEPLYNRDPNDPTRVDCQNDGPRLAFRSLLDSGATFPSLHTEDLISLGIDGQMYGAQCVDLMNTAAGPARARVFEMFVCVLDNDGRQLIDPNNAVYPLSHAYLGGLCPVVENIVPLKHDANGLQIAQRLSGMLPFVACYVSSAPTRDFLFLGEDRNDVLGSHRMPGQKKWSIEIGPIPAGLPFDRYGNPKVTFNHRNGMIVDQDRANTDHASTITFLAGQPNQVVIDSNPRARQVDNALATVGNYVGGLGSGGGRGGGGT